MSTSSSTERSTLVDPTAQIPSYSGDERTFTGRGHNRESSLLRRSWNAFADAISPFSRSALSLLPKVPAGLPDREVRADPLREPGSSTFVRIRDYNSVNPALPPNVPVPRKVPTPIRVEGKVWFANERSKLSVSHLLLLAVCV